MDKERFMVKILTDLFDVNGNLVAVRGSKITKSFMRSIIRRGVPLQKKQVTLGIPFFLKDMRAIMNEENCREIFKNLETQNALLSIVKRTRLQRSLYEEIVPIRDTSVYNYRHFILIGLLSAKMAMDLRMPGLEPDKAFLYGFVHDIGKTRIPQKILNKVSPLTREEYKLLHTHPVKSYILLYYYMGPSGSEAADVGFTHHEKLDGSGYPRGIRKLGTYAKLVAVTDIFDALVADRPYRKRPFTVRSALDRLIADMDDGMLPAFPIRLLVSYFRRKKENFRALKLSRHAREPEPEGNLYGKVAKS